MKGKLPFNRWLLISTWEAIWDMIKDVTPALVIIGAFVGAVVLTR